MLEKNFTIKVKNWLKALPNTWFVKIQQTAVSGTPDILACVNGTFLALELKRSESATKSPLQKHNISKIREANGYAVFLYPENFDEITTDLERIANDHSQSKRS